ncbi:MAG: hypothetical protein ABW069_16010, partial [Duganella sp.]
GNASRCEYVAAVVALSGIAVDVKPSTAASFARKARVSNNEMAANWKMAMLGWPDMPDWRDSLAAYLQGDLAHY